VLIPPDFQGLVRDDVAAAALVGAAMEGRAGDFVLQSGTDFERRVWAALRELPRGQTVTYGALAAQLGNPRGARAVARACAANRLALLVPCHRVVPAAGGVGGYRWGAALKRHLLELEGALPPGAQ
jgi:AraC family transcriptional regulator of adaptative response/methylated-DNA-[protein]-cysteine methyltransferase